MQISGHNNGSPLDLKRCVRHTNNAMTGIQIKEDLTIPDTEISFKATRSSGPGGQHVNKTSSRITLFWHIGSSAALSDWQKEAVSRFLASRISQEGFLVIHVESTRSQFRNKEIALELLASLVTQALTPKKKRRTSKPRPGAIARRVDEKVKRGEQKSGRKKITDW